MISLSPSLLIVQACLALSTGAPCPQTPQLPSEREQLERAPGAFTPSGSRRYAGSDFPLSLTYVGAPPQGLNSAQIDEAMSQAARSWSEVPCSLASFTYAGRVSTLEDAPAGHVIVTHLNEAEAPCLTLSMQTRVGAAPCALGPMGREAAVFNRDAVRWYQFDTEVRYPEGIDQREWIDFRAALTHELGHILGLNHPGTSEREARAAMHSSYRLDAGQARLAAYDRAQLCALYPLATAAPGCSDRESCVGELEDPGARCVELGAWRVCDKERGELNDYCADNVLICDELCLITSEMTRTGYCTKRCERDEECAAELEMWRCDREAVEGLQAGVCRPEIEEEPEALVNEVGCSSAAAGPRRGSPRRGPAAALLLALCLGSIRRVRRA